MRVDRGWAIVTERTISPVIHDDGSVSSRVMSEKVYRVRDFAFLLDWPDDPDDADTDEAEAL